MARPEAELTAGTSGAAAAFSTRSVPENALKAGKARCHVAMLFADESISAAKLPEMINFIQSIAAKYNLRIGTFGHMGDGNLHPTFLVDEKRVEEMERVEKAMREIFEFAIKLGGTITGEHGVGLAKKKFLPAALGNASLNMMKQLKAVLDRADGRDKDRQTTLEAETTFHAAMAPRRGVHSRRPR